MERIIDVSMKVASLMKVAKKMSLLSVFLLLHTKLSNNKISINVLLQSVEVEENFFLNFKPINQIQFQQRKHI